MLYKISNLTILGIDSSIEVTKSKTTKIYYSRLKFSEHCSFQNRMNRYVTSLYNLYLGLSNNCRAYWHGTLY
jgi:hypothetical protein